MHEQIIACQEGCEILVCTPVRKKVLDCCGVNFVILMN